MDAIRMPSSNSSSFVRSQPQNRSMGLSIGTKRLNGLYILPNRSPRLICGAQAASRFNRKDMQQQMRDMRKEIEVSDPRVQAMMAGLRGSNTNTDDFAGAEVKMNLIDTVDDQEGDEALPLIYEPETISAYWGRRPVSIIKRVFQLMGIAGGFMSRLTFDALNGRLKETEVDRAIDLRNIMTSLGPAYIKLGQALSIRPDLLSPAAMNELQKLCDKVPSFPTPIAMQVIQDELGKPWYECFAELTPAPIAAASLGQVYKGKLFSGEEVAVKVQRPYVLETVTVDLYIIRQIGLALRTYFPGVSKRADIVALLDEWAARFFEELDYVKEGQNASRFAEMMRVDLPQVVVPATFYELTSRRVLTSGWMDGEKLSQSQSKDVSTLVNVGVICFLKQLLEHGFFHADPHPGNLIRTPDGRLGILDFGLVTTVDDDIKFGMIEAISHLIHRDYEAIVEDFVTLQFIPKGTDLQPILPVLSKVFDQALAGGGAKSINFQDLAADLAQITFDYPFQIPPYFALIIRAISVLEGIALVGNPDFAIVDEAYPYIAKRLLTDDSPRLRAALKYMVYGKNDVFDADRLIDLLSALEDYSDASTSARGDLDVPSSLPSPSSSPTNSSIFSPFGGGFFPQPWSPLFPQSPVLAPSFFNQMVQLSPFASALQPLSVAQGAITVSGSSRSSDGQTREALRFILSPNGVWFREFVMDELVKSIDALSREQFVYLLTTLGLQGTMVPILIPGVKRSIFPLAPNVTEEDKLVVANVSKIVSFLTQGQSLSTFLLPSPSMARRSSSALIEVLPVLPELAMEIVPQLANRLVSRIGARLIRDLYSLSL